MKVKLLSHVRFFVTQWTVAYEFPPSMGFSQQEYWSGLPFPTPDDLPDPGIESWSSALQADSLPSEPLEKPLEMHTYNLLKSCIYFFLLVEEVLPVSLLHFTAF